MKCETFGVAKATLTNGKTVGWHPTELWGGPRNRERRRRSSPSLAVHAMTGFNFGESGSTSLTVAGDKELFRYGSKEIYHQL